MSVLKKFFEANRKIYFKCTIQIQKYFAIFSFYLDIFTEVFLNFNLKLFLISTNYFYKMNVKETI